MAVTPADEPRDALGICWDRTFGLGLEARLPSCQARIIKDGDAKTKFANVAGCDGAKTELMEVSVGRTNGVPHAVGEISWLIEKSVKQTCRLDVLLIEKKSQVQKWFVGLFVGK